MPVTLTIRDVRDTLMRQDEPGDGPSSSPEAGRLFHDVFAALTVEGMHRALREDEAKRGEVLRTFAYDQVFGPRLTRDRAYFRAQGALVAASWDAVERLCDWLIELGPSTIRMTAEEAVSVELREPGWRDSVRLVGLADGVIRSAESGRWCVVELKLGRGHPRADVAQAALYHLALASRGQKPGALALVRFSPEREEQVIEATALDASRPSLLALIGKMAGVISETRAFEPPSDEVNALGRRLIAVFGEYGVDASLVGEPIVGPTIVRYRLEPGPGVKVAALEQRAREVRMRLELDAEPMIGIADGSVVIDLQRRPRRVVPFAEVRDQIGASNDLLGVPRVPIGVGLDGKLRLADLARTEHTHFLVAGTTGSGKSEWLRTAIAGLLLANSPETLQLILIDPKRTAFGWLRESPFLLRPIVFPDESAPADVLTELIEVMEGRYRDLAATGVDHRDELVRKTGRPMPRVVCVCDEYFDLVQGDAKHVRRIEQLITKLGAKARAAGIHLILATQQPSRKVLTGALDANVSARVALRMEKPMESHMILKQGGAEALLGNGDLLFKDGGEPVRLQAPLLSAEERAAIGRLGRRGRSPIR
jgi:hypothetical protein